LLAVTSGAVAGAGCGPPPPVQPVTEGGLKPMSPERDKPALQSHDAMLQPLDAPE